MICIARLGLAFQELAEHLAAFRAEFQLGQGARVLTAVMPAQPCAGLALLASVGPLRVLECALCSSRLKPTRNGRRSGAVSPASARWGRLAWVTNCAETLAQSQEIEMVDGFPPAARLLPSQRPIAVLVPHLPHGYGRAAHP